MCIAMFFVFTGIGTSMKLKDIKEMAKDGALVMVCGHDDAADNRC